MQVSQLHASKVSVLLSILSIIQFKEEVLVSPAPFIVANVISLELEIVTTTSAM